jgi:hypothetical protein
VKDRSPKGPIAITWRSYCNTPSCSGPKPRPSRSCWTMRTGWVSISHLQVRRWETPHDRRYRRKESMMRDNSAIIGTANGGGVTP